jgi:16S rRNA (cytosine1402-N4)-methyltransferase
MRMDTTRGVPASAWLATETQENLEKVIRDYGEERFAFQIAKAIVARRAVEPITSTGQLAALVAGAVKTREKGKDPATRTFQAVRIFINKELEELEAGLTQAYGLLAPYGRLVVISFHSLEDRIVKRFMASKASVPQPDRRLPIRAVDLPQPAMKLLARIKPSDAEIAANPRARSAVLLVLCSLLLVNSQHQARRLFVALEQAQLRQQQLETEWSQLQLEQSNLAKHARIDAMAKSMGMAVPTADRTRYVTVGGR